MLLSDQVGRRMKLQNLHVLMTVVQTGSMVKAAERLNTVQPAISRSISELEHTLGVRLLERHRQGVEPTEYGRVLLDCGLAVFDDLRLGLQGIEHLADPTSGEVRIGCSPLLAASFVAAVVDRLARRYPRIVFHLVAVHAETLYRDLTDRNVDLLIARRFGPLTDDRLDYEFLFHDPYVVVAGAKSPWARRRNVTLADLANEPWILQAQDTALGSVVAEAFRANNPRTVIFANSPEVRISLVATGRYLTIFPASSLQFPNRHQEIKALPITVPMAPMPIGIITLKNRMTSAVAKLFMEHAREVAKPLTKKK